MPQFATAETIEIGGFGHTVQVPANDLYNAIVKLCHPGEYLLTPLETTAAIKLREVMLKDRTSCRLGL
ncbi:MAG: hypothetical protein EBR02_01705 [Alphaproteobacteria bacterium]|nr:hypothetical protein [Alphaproteobacteria bacterium]